MHFHLNLLFIKCPKGDLQWNLHVTMALLLFFLIDLLRFSFIVMSEIKYITFMQRDFVQDVQHSIIKQQYSEWISISSFLYSRAELHWTFLAAAEKWKRKMFKRPLWEKRNEMKQYHRCFIADPCNERRSRSRLVLNHSDRSCVCAKNSFRLLI